MNLPSEVEEKLISYMTANEFEPAINMCVSDDGIYKRISVLNWIKNTFRYAFNSGYQLGEKQGFQRAVEMLKLKGTQEMGFSQFALNKIADWLESQWGKE